MESKAKSMRVAVGGAALALAAATATPALAQSGAPIADSYICAFKRATTEPNQVASRANAAASANGGQIKHIYRNTLRGFALRISPQGLRAMRARNPDIAFCEQDRIMQLPSISAKPGGGGATAQSTPDGITRVNGVSGATNARRAWVIDSGVDLDHPDLNVSGDVSQGGLSKNFVPRETSPDDLNGHGSHVAGTIAALNNAFGVVGVSPGSQVVAVRVLNRRGSGAYADVIAGVEYVGTVATPGDVANMSLGGPVSSALDIAVITAAGKGIHFTLAAGNDSDDAANHSPARAEGPNIYTVSAINSADTFASFSNFGAGVDYAEPGVSISSTWKDGGYNTISGTSMAAPHLAGILLLGSVTSEGTAKSDPDGKPDPIGVH